MSILNITNGDFAAEVMRKAGIDGDIVCWRDVLHEGPVPAGLDLSELSEIRAAYIVAQGWGDEAKVKDSFIQRDAILARFRDFSRVCLWFEHDLYDQLQLIQILDWLATQDRAGTAIDMVCVDEYLGRMDAVRMAQLNGRSSPVSADQLRLAQVAWNAFRAPEPTQWAALCHTDTVALPFLRGAVVRHLEQFPSTQNGLNRTEQQILQAVVAGHVRPPAIFGENQRADGIRFMGDTTFWGYIDGLFDSSAALLRRRDDRRFERAVTQPYTDAFRHQELELTPLGQQVLCDDADWLSNKTVDKCYGGVALSPTNMWRWDRDECVITKQ